MLGIEMKGSNCKKCARMQVWLVGGRAGKRP